MNPTPEDAPPPLDWAKDEDEKGFWTRFKEAWTGPGAEVAPPPAPVPGDVQPEVIPVAGLPAPEPALAEPRPRKIKRTVFDGGTKPDSRRTRLRRAAQEKRESLALVVGAEVEKVIVEKIQPRDEEMGKVAQGFGALNEVLAKIPESAGVQIEALSGQLTALQHVRGELELHRAQRERVIDGVQRLEKALEAISEKLGVQEQKARELAQEERRVKAEEAERLERNMAFFAARVHEQSAAILAAQEASAEGYRSSQRAVIDAFDDTQARARSEMERREADREERAIAAEKDRVERARVRQAKSRRSSRLALVGALLVLCALGGLGWAFRDLDEQRATVARDAEERADRAFELVRTRSAVATVSSSTTLPAGFPK